jgi:Holliday junction DNA helicase RuvA
MLAVLEPDTLRTALAEGDLPVLTRVPGIGRKGAERLVVELRDKVGGRAPATSGPAASGASAVRTQVTEALAGLGFPARQAEQAVDAVLAEADRETTDTSQVLRSALTRLGRNR